MEVSKDLTNTVAEVVALVEQERTDYEQKVSIVAEEVVTNAQEVFDEPELEVESKQEAQAKATSQEVVMEQALTSVLIDQSAMQEPAFQPKPEPEVDVVDAEKSEEVKETSKWSFCSSPADLLSSPGTNNIFQEFELPIWKPTANNGSSAMEASQDIPMQDFSVIPNSFDFGLPNYTPVTSTLGDDEEQYFEIPCQSLQVEAVDDVNNTNVLEEISTLIEERGCCEN